MANRMTITQADLAQMPQSVQDRIRQQLSEQPSSVPKPARRRRKRWLSVPWWVCIIVVMYVLILHYALFRLLFP